MSRIGRRIRDSELTSGEKCLIQQCLVEFRELLQPDADLSVFLAPTTSLQRLDVAITAIEQA